MNNEDVTPNTSVSKVFSDDFWGTPIGRKTSHKSYRPLTVIAFQLDYWLAGGRKPMVFHLTNVLLHPLVTWFYMVVCERVVRDGDLVGRWRESGRGNHMTSIGVIAGLMFAVHPVHTESVSTLW